MYLSAPKPWVAPKLWVALPPEHRGQVLQGEGEGAIKVDFPQKTHPTLNPAVAIPQGGGRRNQLKSQGSLNSLLAYLFLSRRETYQLS